MYSSKLRRLSRTALPTLAAWMSPERTSFQSVERPSPAYLSASGYRSQAGCTSCTAPACITDPCLRLRSSPCTIQARKVHKNDVTNVYHVGDKNLRRLSEQNAKGCPQAYPPSAIEQTQRIRRSDRGLSEG